MFSLKVVYVLKPNFFFAGDFEFVANIIKDYSRKMDKLYWEVIHSTLTVTGSDHRVEKHTKLCSDIHGLLNFIRYASFGRFARYSDQISAASLMDNASCLVCGTRNCKLRCGRCKFVYYCSKAHQSEDWKNHKVSFISNKIEFVDMLECS